jgi:hypothetical protein
MKRVAIVVVSTLLVLTVASGAALIAWQIRSLKAPQAEFLVKAGLAHSSGFSGVRIEHVASGWNAAEARSTLFFSIRGFATDRVSADVDFVRVGGSWRVLGVHAGGREYPSLEDLADDEMADLRAEHVQHLADVTVQNAQAAGEIAVELGKRMGDSLTETWREMTE